MTRRVLDLLLHDRVIGEIRHEAETIEVLLSDEYLDTYPRPVLGQTFEEQRRRARWSSNTRLPEWFSNLLPEGALRTLVAQHVGVHESREFFLLAHLGADLPGAVVVRPRDGEVIPDDDGRVDGPAPDEPALRFSLAGVQLKFSVVQESGRLTIPAVGSGGGWIVKLADLRHEAVPENEATMMAWARAGGIEVPEFFLTTASDIDGIPERVAVAHAGSAYAVQRFDRIASGRRVHMEDFAQVLGIYPERKYDDMNYETVANIVFKVAGAPALEEFVRRLVFVVLSGNGDAHLKNWSLMLYSPGALLSPAYDFVSTVVYDPYRRDGLALKFGGQKAFAEVAPSRFARLAERVGYDTPLRLRELAEDTAVLLRDVWPRVAAESPMLVEHRARLEEHLASVRLGRRPG